MLNIPFQINESSFFWLVGVKMLTVLLSTSKLIITGGFSTQSSSTKSPVSYPLANKHFAIENGPVEIVVIFPLIAWWFSMIFHSYWDSLPVSFPVRVIPVIRLSSYLQSCNSWRPRHTWRIWRRWEQPMIRELVMDIDYVHLCTSTYIYRLQT